MTPEQFLLFLQSFGNDVISLPKHPFLKEWAKVVNDIHPHYFGTIPKALELTFPNENEEVWTYRKNTYQAKTKSLVVDAVDKLSRMLSTSKYSINYESERMKNYVQKIKEIDSELIPQFFLKKFISKRVLDPNAVLLVSVKGQGLNDATTEVDFDFNFIASKEIEFYDNELNIIIYKEPSENKYIPQSNERFLVVTDNFYGRIYVENQKRIFEVIYAHNLGFMPLVVLGGRPITKGINGHEFNYFESDISDAVAFMNDAATSDNQHKTVVNSVCFPITVYNEGIECTSCFGAGHVQSPTPHEPDRLVSCGTCNGGGRQYTSPLQGIYISKPAGGISDQTISNKPVIEFISPSTDTIKVVGEYAAEKMQQAKEALDINKAVKHAQSGIAKEIDKEGVNIDIAKISDEVYAKMNHILYVIQGLVFLDIDSGINVIQPTSFDVKNQYELFEEYKASVSGGTADFVREATFSAWVNSRFSTDYVTRRIGEICILYAPAYLYTVIERKEMFLMGTLKQDDLIRATYGFNAVQLMYNQDSNSINNSIGEIITKLDGMLLDRFEQKIDLTLPEIDPNSLA